jgi:hypothetical protein
MNGISPLRINFHPYHSHLVPQEPVLMPFYSFQSEVGLLLKKNKMLQEVHQLIREKFDAEAGEREVPELNLGIRTFPFVSVPGDSTNEVSMLHELRTNMMPDCEDEDVLENRNFRYPIFYPSKGSSFNRAIFLLHGLNERKWDKYYVWAHYLVEKLQLPVILFPISFHLNRCPQAWIDPRMLAQRVELRKRQYLEAEDSTFVNLALSERLTAHPERFYLSGLQTIDDLTRLMREIQSGRHPLFEQNSRIDFFAYSIGGLLSQVLMIANPDGLLDRSKFFFFSAGSTFSDMHGASKLIMDTAAHERVQHFYRVDLENSLNEKGRIRDFFHGTRLGMAFRSMVAPDRYQQLREKTFLGLKNRIKAVAVENDLVIPAGKIRETFQCSQGKLPENVSILAPAYPYTHENPFPFKLTEYSRNIELVFQQVFGSAAAFLA